MTATATYQQFAAIVLVENNPQILYTVSPAGRMKHVHIRSWRGIVLTLLQPPTENEFVTTFTYARKVETLEA